MGCGVRWNGRPIHSELISSTTIDVFPVYKKEVEAFQIKYSVGELAISGFILKPIQSKGKSPMIIYCRGGNRDYGAIDQTTLAYLAYIASQGYVVMASQYRGNSFSDGKDEFGGEDVKDALALIDIAKEVGYVDLRRIGVLGYSRGGLMAYLMSKKSDKIKAIAVVGAPTDAFRTCRERPEMYREVLLPLVGDSVHHRQDFIDRSPLYWANAINEPVLLLHGTADVKVDVEQASLMVDALKANGNEFSYKLFEGGNHPLQNFREQRDSMIFDWFKRSF
ncbi:MAG: S9 family peptidase [Saprospiraceae bacterium]|nr:S9 family peptidase [Saprospiraceae bacterium]